MNGGDYATHTIMVEEITCNACHKDFYPYKTLNHGTAIPLYHCPNCGIRVDVGEMIINQLGGK